MTAYIRLGSLLSLLSLLRLLPRQLLLEKVVNFYSQAFFLPFLAGHPVAFWTILILSSEISCAVRRVLLMESLLPAGRPLVHCSGAGVSYVQLSSSEELLML